MSSLPISPDGEGSLSADLPMVVTQLRTVEQSLQMGRPPEWRCLEAES